MSIQFKSINKLRGTRAVFFGGTTGIGLAAAAAALEHGATIWVCSRKQKNVDAALKSLKDHYNNEDFHSRIHGLTCDLGNVNTIEENMIRVFEAATDGGKTLVDHVVSTVSSVPVLVPLQEASAQKIVDSAVPRFLTPLLIGKFSHRYMKISNKSSITLTSGSMARRPEKNWSILASFAGGIETMRLTMGVDLAPIRVNCVSPGACQTPLFDHLPAESKPRLLSQLLTGEFGWPEDIAEAYVYSMKDRSATGALIDSNEGRYFS
ncbi:NAD(P)-binding protein [Corynespora cassiicola Philippines]|uniref:NAD(P)-binding protein n=1 Tax=Corynespora cassiicola Philippines TaxID=1448308 RepID=A0A2T2NQG9_CORCC|nr:NAD(P)-binding protein [Corynespora cassiicola Philippines]